MKISNLNIVFLLFGLLVSCQPKEKFDWEIGISAPEYYSSLPNVAFFYNGGIVHNVSSNIGIDPGWGETSGGYASGKEHDQVPDSLAVNWDCGIDLVEYELKVKLPREKMLRLFQEPVTDYNGDKDTYSLIIVGTAPGGNVTVWMRAGFVLTEIAKFKAKEVKKIDPYDKDRVTLWTSTGDEAKENFLYLYLHGVPYEVWEKGEKEYDYDIGFTSEGNDVKGFIFTSNAKDGSWYQAFTGVNKASSADIVDWDTNNYIANNNLVKKRKVPVQIKVSWDQKNTNTVLQAEVVMPQNLESLMNEPFIDEKTGKKEFYDRIVVGAYKNGTKGCVWLTGKNKKIKLMDFVLDDVFNKEIKKHVLYSLPKGFVFPEWKGREKLIIPDVEFWQEK